MIQGSIWTLGLYANVQLIIILFIILIKNSFEIEHFGPKCRNIQRIADDKISWVSVSAPQLKLVRSVILQLHLS